MLRTCAATVPRAVVSFCRVNSLRGMVDDARSADPFCPRRRILPHFEAESLGLARETEVVFR